MSARATLLDVVGMSAVMTLSFSRIGMQCSDPTDCGSWARPGLLGLAQTSGLDACPVTSSPITAWKS